MPDSRREKQRDRTRCLRGNSSSARTPQSPTQTAGLAARVDPPNRTRAVSEQRQPRPSCVKRATQIALQSWVSGRKSQLMSTAEQTTSKLAKNWPSRVFRGLRSQITEVEIRLYLQGFSCWWAQQDLNLRPSDYESPALTAELWARGVLVGFWWCRWPFTTPKSGVPAHRGRALPPVGHSAYLGSHCFRNLNRSLSVVRMSVVSLVRMLW